MRDCVVFVAGICVCIERNKEDEGDVDIGRGVFYYSCQLWMGIFARDMEDCDRTKFYGKRE